MLLSIDGKVCKKNGLKLGNSVQRHGSLKIAQSVGEKGQRSIIART